MDVGQTYVRGKTGLNVGRKVSEKQYRKGQYCRNCDGKEGECASEVELAYHAVHTSEIEHASDVVDEGDSIDSQKDEQDCERRYDDAESPLWVLAGGTLQGIAVRGYEQMFSEETFVGERLLAGVGLKYRIYEVTYCIARRCGVSRQRIVEVKRLVCQRVGHERFIA